MNVFEKDRPFILGRGIILAVLILAITVHAWTWFGDHTPKDLVFNRCFLSLMSLVCLLSLVGWTIDSLFPNPSDDEEEKLGNLPSGISRRQRLRNLKL